MSKEDMPFTIPVRFPKVDPSKGKWVALSNANVSKIVSQGDERELVLKEAKKKGCLPPILVMHIDRSKYFFEYVE